MKPTREEIEKLARETIEELRAKKTAEYAARFETESPAKAELRAAMRERWPFLPISEHPLPKAKAKKARP